jgi:Tol biopolymer transport system component
MKPHCSVLSRPGSAHLVRAVVVLGLVGALPLGTARAADQASQETGPVFHQDVSWSPDGRRIAFSARENNNWRIYVGDATSGTTTPVTQGLTADQWTSWAPDNRHIAYASKPPDGQADIFVVDVDVPGHPQRLTVSTGPRNTEPAWAPDGQAIAFVSKRDNDHQQIWLMDKDGANQRRLTSLPANAETPSWSPDGQKIVFYTDAGDGKDQVWTANRDGSALTNITHDDGHHIYPAWTRDNHIVFSTIDAKDEPSPMIVRPDGSDRQVLVPQHAFFARVSPDGARVVLLVGQYPKNAVLLCDRSGATCRSIQP